MTRDSSHDSDLSIHYRGYQQLSVFRLTESDRAFAKVGVRNSKISGSDLSDFLTNYFQVFLSISCKKLPVSRVWTQARSQDFDERSRISRRVVSREGLAVLWSSLFDPALPFLPSTPTSTPSRKW